MSFDMIFQIFQFDFTNLTYVQIDIFRIPNSPKLLETSSELLPLYNTLTLIDTGGG